MAHLSVHRNDPDDLQWKEGLQDEGIEMAVVIGSNDGWTAIGNPLPKPNIQTDQDQHQWPDKQALEHHLQQ